MTLPYDISRCLGVRMEGLDCPRMDKCRRYIERADRGPATPVQWHVCHPRDAEFKHQIKVQESAQ